MSFRPTLTGLFCALLVLPATASADLLPAGSTALVGAAAAGSFAALPTPVGPSGLGQGSISQDGRYVAFSSDADGLSGEDDDRVRSVYVKDRTSGDVELVSRATGPAGAVNTTSCGEPSISDDGQRVAFSCGGALEAADTNTSRDVYLRDRGTGVTSLVSRTAGAVGNGSSDSPQISGNGAYVVFASYATNLVLNGPVSGSHVYRRLLGGLNVIDLVDRPNAASIPNGRAYGVTISDDGTRVAFGSSATNLVPGVTDANGYEDVFWRNMATSTTGLVSGVNGSATVAAAGGANQPAISGNGAYVAFSSTATDIGDGDVDSGADVHRRTLATSAVVLIDRATGTLGAKATGYQYGPAIDASGDAVSFVSTSPVLDPAASTAAQVYLRRVGAATTELVSRQSGSGPVAAADVSAGVLSGDGGTAAVVARGLTGDADPILDAVFARALTGAKATSLVSRPAGTAPFVNAGAPADMSVGALSADGRYAVYTSAATGLPGQAVPGVDQAWRRDTLTGEVVLASRADGAGGAAADADVHDATISADGSRVAFASAATNLGQSGTGASVHVRDLDAQRTLLVSRADGAEGTPADDAKMPSISADGRRVAFISASPALGAAGGNRHVFVRDVVAGSTTPVAAQQDGNADVPDLSAGGGRVVWELRTPGADKKSSQVHHVWVADVAGGAPVQVDAGASATDDGLLPTISDDGSRVAFSSTAPLIASDTNTSDDMYVRDLASGAAILASVAGDGALGDGGSSGGAVSGDGRSVAFASSADNLVAGDVNDKTDAFVRDLDAGTTALASRGDGIGGVAADAHVYAVATTANGGCVAFETQSTAFAVGLSPFVERVWLRAVKGTCPVSPAAASGGPGGGQAGGGGAGLKPTLHRPVLGRLTAKPAKFATRGRKAGTTLHFTLDQAARVKIVVARATKGHRVRGRCRAGKAKKHQKRCTLLRSVATLARSGTPGANRVRFMGRVKGRRLARGSYVATATATSPGGRSKPVTVKLTIR